MGDDKKCKKELSSDAVELSGGLFYPELSSTIVRVAWQSLSLPPRTSASNTEINSYDHPLRNCTSNLSVHLFLVFLVAFLLVFDWKVVSLRAINKENSTSFIVLYLVSNGAEVIVSTFSHTDIDRGYFAFLITQAP